MTIIKCENCKNETEKEETEIKRQLKKNPNRLFFCSLSCSCSYYLKIKPRKGSQKGLVPGNRLDEYSPYKYYYNRSRLRDPLSDLDLEYLKTLWQEQKGCCALTGIKFTEYKTSKEFSLDSNNPWKPSLDRIDSSLGYTKGNVRYICMIANFAKNQWSDEILIELCKLIVNYHN